MTGHPTPMHVDGSQIPTTTASSWSLLTVVVCSSHTCKSKAPTPDVASATAMQTTTSQASHYSTVQITASGWITRFVLLITVATTIKFVENY